MGKDGLFLLQKFLGEMWQCWKPGFVCVHLSCYGSWCV